ncbi:peptidase associated/transthyretin-like domain-containing protein [Nonlabens xiamenensis]|uniref:carboxypeptidase-like regulatory domain-containing protein n=1 Tax=Nonlabens xiamenensis TaxID=2341043 RepID=UPI000F60E90F|nr:carboxypeptidase-like regulatory domain-containing protein [Nonlabens xiamenensis]
MKNLFWISLIGLLAQGVWAQDVQIKDAESLEPIAFATISFGNGKGTFADDEGSFRFSKKLYADVDSLFFSSIGYADKGVAVNELSDTVLLNQEADELETVVLTTALTGKFKTKEIDEQGHENYFDCWLPTVESEIAVRFDRYEGEPSQIIQLKLPVLVEESQVSKKGKLRRFSTMFRVSFYDVDPDGSPSRKSYYPSKTFIIDQTTEETFELNIEDLKINIPVGGLFASIQVLGYTKPDGKLIKAKKYREIKTRTGVEKVSTTYRPLLPFTDEIEGKKTWVRRIFFNNKTWQLFDLTYNPNSKLVSSGHDNYGMGAEFKVYYRD